MPHPLNPQSLNRFSYTLNNPVRYVDPTGHKVDEGTDGGGSEGTGESSEEEETEEETACAENDADCDGVADGEQTETPADTGEEQGPEEKPEEKCGPHAINCELAEQFYNASVLLDVFELILAAEGELMTIGLVGIGGIFGGGLQGMGEGYIASQGLWNTSVGNLETFLSAMSMTAVTVGDVLAGETRIDGKDFILGANTANSAVTTAISGIPTTETSLAGTFFQVFENDFHMFHVQDRALLMHYETPIVISFANGIIPSIR